MVEHAFASGDFLSGGSRQHLLFIRSERQAGRTQGFFYRQKIAGRRIGFKKGNAGCCPVADTLVATGRDQGKAGACSDGTYGFPSAFHSSHTSEARAIFCFKTTDGRSKHGRVHGEHEGIEPHDGQWVERPRHGSLLRATEFHPAQPASLHVGSSHAHVDHGA